MTNGVPDRRLDAVTDALRSLPLEQRVPGYGCDEVPGKAELLGLLETGEPETCPHGEQWACSECGCPRGVAGCDGSACQWRCPDCGCRNCHEGFCYLCGAGSPEDED